MILDTLENNTSVILKVISFLQASIQLTYSKYFIDYNILPHHLSQIHIETYVLIPYIVLRKLFQNGIVTVFELLSFPYFVLGAVQFFTHLKASVIAEFEM